MWTEAAVVIDKFGAAVYWHTPQGRTGGSIPDSHSFWEYIWANRERIAGIAHSHPGAGVPGPSQEDVTTFSAIELALGRKLWWWITSSDEVVKVTWKGPGAYQYIGTLLDKTPNWAHELRRISAEGATNG